MTRGSPHHEHVRREFAGVCDGCAALCEQDGGPDGAFKRCADISREKGGHR